MQKLVQLLENNSRLCQRSTLTADQALISTERLYIRLQELRSEEEFQLLFERAVSLVDIEVYNEATAAKRKRAASSSLSDFITYSPAPTKTTNMDESDVLRANFYGAIDVISQAIKNRFDHDDFRKPIRISNYWIGAANKELCKDVNDKLACISELIKLDALIEELQELPTYIKLHNKESGIPIKRVTKIDTICELMCSKDCCKECLPELHRFLQLYNSVALFSATAERTFSAMCRIKSWTKSNMTANSLSNKMFANLHKQ